MSRVNVLRTFVRGMTWKHPGRGNKVPMEPEPYDKKQTEQTALGNFIVASVLLIVPTWFILRNI